MIRPAQGQPTMHHERPKPRCSEPRCQRPGHFNRLCAKHADEAEARSMRRQFAVLDSYQT